MKRVAVLGLGVMGGAIARNLLRAGFEVGVWNRTRARAEAIEGARVAATPREAAAEAEAVVCVVSDDEASRAAWMGEEGALAGAARGAVLIESGTLSPAWVEEWAQHVRRHGSEPLDAPISGSRTSVEAREITFFVGGDASTVERARPVLSATSKGILHVGPIGHGARMKLVNNLVGSVQLASVAEGILLAERMGLDMEKVSSVLSNGSCGSPFVRAAVPRIVARDYRLHFSLSLMEKDMRYALDEASRHGLRMPTLSRAKEVIEEALSMGLGAQDLSSMAEALRAK